MGDPEDHAIKECKGVLQHKALDFAVIHPAPIVTVKKCPADFNFAFVLFVIVITAGADNCLSFVIYNSERRSRGCLLYTSDAADE